jgi:hypothetical protein
MDIKVDDKQIRAALAAFPDLVSKAIGSALRNTAIIVENKLEAELIKSIDRPVGFTAGRKNAWYQSDIIDNPSLKRRRIGIKARQASYLQFLVKGKARDDKIIERKTPDGRIMTPSRFVKLDQYGNVPRAQYTRMFQAAFRKAKRTEYFFMSKKRGKMYPGIYRKNEKGVPVPMFFAHGAAQNYGKRFDFYGVAERTAKEHMRDAIAEAITVRLRQANGR